MLNTICKNFHIYTIIVKAITANYLVKLRTFYTFNYLIQVYL